MRDQLASFCDPSPEFRVAFTKDSTGKEFVVIQIAPFRDLPLLSKKGIPGGILANTIYHRNSNKRVESAPVSSSNDLRGIIELAARNLHRRLTDLGYKLESGLEKAFAANMASLPHDGLVATIKAASHWEVEFWPGDDQQIAKLRVLREKVEKAAVRINWPLPFYSDRVNETEGIKNGEGFIEGFTSQWYQFELWRLYTSGHFIFFRMLRADAGLLPPHSPEKGTFVSLLDSIIHFITEVVQFLNRLMSEGLYKSGVRLNMKLQNVDKRALFLDDPSRSPLYNNRIADSNVITVNRSLSSEELKDDPDGISRQLILEILESFNFKPPQDFITRFQEEYLQRR
jgi:hypothetical protein